MNQSDWALLFRVSTRVDRFARPRDLDLENFAALELLGDTVCGTLTYLNKGNVPEDIPGLLDQLSSLTSEVRDGLLSHRYNNERDVLIAGYYLWLANEISTHLDRSA